MELPQRGLGDVLLPADEMRNIRHRLRNLAAHHDLATVIAYAFDHRARALPFIFADLRMPPAGVRAIGSALVDAGFPKTRIVLQQWNPHFQPSQMRLDGRIPDLFLVSSMHLYATACDRLIQDACRIDPAQRPLIIGGGPRMIYAPWEVFGTDRDHVWGADVVVTGDEYVFLNLLETLLTARGRNESLRSAFQRVRDHGGLDEIPGLVYSRSSTADGPPEELVDTGIPRLLGDLDELPSPVLGYRLLEPPSRGPTLQAEALPANRVREHSLFASLLLTQGCRFRCAYCPVPAYNQRQYRVKSGERVADEMAQLAETYRIINFFGADDNFFNHPPRTLEIAEALARRVRTGQRPYCKIRYGTEATVHDTLRLAEHLPVLRQSGLWALWMGVEDLTGTLVRKGQSEGKTLEAFRLLRQNGIMPMPMLMHDDSQPLVSWKTNRGLLNQVRLLRRAGAIHVQILALVPAHGSKWYVDTYTSGLAFESVGGKPIEPYQIDGNYIVASKHPRPWVKQLNLLVAYAYFFNPLRLLSTLVWSKSAIPFADVERRPPEEIQAWSRGKRIRRWLYRKLRARLADTAMQLIGMGGLFLTARRTLRWAWRLFRGNIRPAQTPPTSLLPMRSAAGGPAAHALPGTPVAVHSPAPDDTAAVPAGTDRKAA